VDNPDLKLQSQGSTVAINHGCSEFVDGAAATAGLADADSSSVCDRDTNYVVFDYPEPLDEPDHYSRVVVNEEKEVIESPQYQQDRNIMGTYPDVRYSSEKSPDDGISADIVRHHLKEDDLLDDFFKFVSNGMYDIPFLFLRFSSRFFPPFSFFVMSIQCNSYDVFALVTFVILGFFFFLVLFCGF
jgi:hypothetical protein